MQACIKYIGLAFILSGELYAQTAIKMDMYVNRVNLDKSGVDCSYQRVLIVIDNGLGVVTDRDTVAILKQSVLENGLTLGVDELHNQQFTYQIFNNDDGFIIFITQLDGKDRFGLVLSTKPCENKNN